MSHLLSWLTSNVHAAAHKCGAASASVYVRTSLDDAPLGLLIHVGEGDPLPEMVDVERAAAFDTAATQQQMSAHTVAAQGPGAPIASGVEADSGCVASTAAGGWLIPIPMLSQHRKTPIAPEPKTPDVANRRVLDRRNTQPIIGWLALRFSEHAPPNRLQQWHAVLSVASTLAATYVSFYGILADPVTGLAGHVELNATVRAELAFLPISRVPFSLIFTKLEGLQGINRRFGRRAGDDALRLFIDVVQRAVRASDPVMRYGASVFALPLRGVSENGARIVADKIHRLVRDARFGPDQVGLTCAVGAVCCVADEIEQLQSFEVLRRADQALAAASERGGNTVVVWQPDGQVARRQPTDPLLGIFTGQADKDYRNMRLLWEVLQALSTSTGADLTSAAVTRLHSLCAATRAALFQADGAGGLRLLDGCTQQDHEHGVRRLNPDELSDEEWALNREAIAQRSVQARMVNGGRQGAARALAAPLMVSGEAIGTLYLQSDADTLMVDHDDFPLIGGIATHLALALDRERLAQEQRGRALREQGRLRSEVERLRETVRKAQFVFHSPQLTELLDLTHRVAPSDATVLITGESGTGKEMLAQTLHALSRRHDRPLVVIDCGAIPASLIDSELFGRERGAYTGAERRSPGRLAQAHGGTVFLDEIGELPLEVQAKLLRFVQERTFTMVGSTQTMRVDVRIVAATNRALEDEVAAGRFREDLFHRLNVVRLRIPPLRDRLGDITLLARHFLKTHGVQNGKPALHFTPEAEQVLVAHPWPGNVRQLQNVVLQAVVLARGDVIGASDLQLPTVAARTAAPVAVPAGEPAGAPRSPVTIGPTDSLRGEIRQHVEACLSSRRLLPLGTWFEHELVLAVFEASQCVVSRAARRLKVPESTFSRRLRGAQTSAAVTQLPPTWESARDAIRQLVDHAGVESDLSDLLEALMLDVLLEVECATTTAAALFGVSVPTWKRRLSERDALRKSA